VLCGARPLSSPCGCAPAQANPEHPFHNEHAAIGGSFVYLLFAAAGYVAATVALFVSFEVRGIDTFMLVSFLAGFWHWAFVAVIGMEVVVHVAAEVVRTVKPRANADEDAAIKPFWTVVACRGASVRSNVVVAVGAYRLYSYADSDLSRRFGAVAVKQNTATAAIINSLSPRMNYPLLWFIIFCNTIAA
jgi:hypothetical protein